MATAVTEMAASSCEVARNATEASSASTEASKAAENGKLIVQQTISSIDRLANNIQNTGEVITVLQKESDDIGSVLAVIRVLQNRPICSL